MLSTGFLIDFNLSQLDQATLAEMRGSWLPRNMLRRVKADFAVNLRVHKLDRVAVKVILEVLLVRWPRSLDGVQLQARDGSERASLAQLLIDSLLLLSFALFGLVSRSRVLFLVEGDLLLGLDFFSVSFLLDAREQGLGSLDLRIDIDGAIVVGGHVCRILLDGGVYN